MAPTAAAAQLAADGMVLLPGRVSSTVLAAMRDAVWAALATRGLMRDDARTWTVGGALPLIEIAGALRPGPGSDHFLWSIGRDPAFAVVPSLLAEALDEVFGPGVWAPLDDQQGGLLMPNFPGAAPPWSVPHAAWHVDEPTMPDQPRPWGLLGFLALDDVPAGGGATVAIAGSPRRLGQVTDASAVRALTTEAALAALAVEPWFAALATADHPGRAAQLQAPYASAGIEQRVIELTGAAGDLTLLDPRALHTVSANTSSRARLVLRLVCARAS